MSKAHGTFPTTSEKYGSPCYNDWKDLLYQVCLNLKPARGSHLSRGERLHLHLLGILRCLCVSASAHIYICSLAACALSVCLCMWALMFESISVRSLHVLKVGTTCRAHVVRLWLAHTPHLYVGEAQRLVVRRRFIPRKRCGQIYLKSEHLSGFFLKSDSLKSAWFQVMKSHTATLHFLAMIELTVDLTYC